MSPFWRLSTVSRHIGDIYRYIYYMRLLPKYGKRLQQHSVCAFLSFFRSGEYSASAIKSASVSWNTLIGCPGYLRWANITTILTLLWIIKFVLAGNGAIYCNRGRNKQVNNRPARRRRRSRSPQEPGATLKVPTAAATTTTRVTSMRTTRMAQSIATASRRIGT